MSAMKRFPSLYDRREVLPSCRDFVCKDSVHLGHARCAT